LETSVTIYQLTWHNNPEDLNSHKNHCEKLNFTIIKIYDDQLKKEKYKNTLTRPVVKFVHSNIQNGMNYL